MEQPRIDHEQVVALTLSSPTEGGSMVMYVRPSRISAVVPAERPGRSTLYLKTGSTIEVLGNPATVLDRLSYNDSWDRRMSDFRAKHSSLQEQLVQLEAAALRMREWAEEARLRREGGANAS